MSKYADKAAQVEALVDASEEEAEIRRKVRIERDPRLRVACPHCAALPGDECNAAAPVGAFHDAREHASNAERGGGDRG